MTFAVSPATSGAPAFSANCPSCGSTKTEQFFELRGLPVRGVEIFENPADARAMAIGDQRLALCHGCGMMFNASFDPNLVDYRLHQEESQHHSPRFVAYARELAGDWVERFSLRGRGIVEVGCGKGDFLREMLRAGTGHALGIDPSFTADEIGAEFVGRLEAITDEFRTGQIPPATEAVLCRHTLEHIARPSEFTSEIVKGMALAGTPHFLMEVPDMGRILDVGAFWDMQYEHCSYYTPVTLAAILSRCGLAVDRAYLTYDDQYIVAEAHLDEAGSRVQDLTEEIASLRRRVQSFSRLVEQIFIKWTGWFEERAGKRDDVVVWGAGAKGLTYLNYLKPTNVDRVVDINPGLQGKYLGGVGLPILAPEQLADRPPTHVLLMNPIYRDEVRGILDRIGLSTVELACV